MQTPHILRKLDMGRERERERESFQNKNFALLTDHDRSWDFGISRKII